MAKKKKNFLSEKEYQRYIIDYLVKKNKYVERHDSDFDRLFAMDRELLFKFLDATQPKTMEALRKIHKQDTEEIIVQVINSECTKDKGSLIKVLKDGVDIGNGCHHLDLMYTKPATTFNKELMKKYEQNIFSVAEEVWANDNERIDLVIFLNGLAIMSFELKCNEMGQTYEDAIAQYRTQRDPMSRLFLFKAGTLVNFAMDLNEVHMCTKLDKEKTYFLPFNMGNGEGVDAGKGNPLREDDYPVCYMWQDVLTKDSILELIKKFIFVEIEEKKNKHGKKEAFHVYSMKQAIEEGFILDVLQNYITYNTYYTLNKEIAEDPKCKTNDAKRQIARYIELNETNVAQRTEIIVEHFRQHVMGELGGQAKAMVLTHYKENALTYYKAFKEYISKKKYSDLGTLVAFSGKVKLDDDDKVYTEVGLNGFPEDQLPAQFNTDSYQVLIVANKYQTGFDQNKLCAMYILKSLNGVNAVQSLSRLNRICPPYNKKTFVLDFVNSYEDMKAAFARYYTTTILSNTVTPSSISEIEAKLDGFYVLDPLDIETGAKLMMKSSITAAEEKQMNFLFGKAENTLKKKDIEEQKEIMTTMRHFVRFYEFLLQATCYEDVELHKKYLFVSAFIDYVDISQPGSGYDLKGKVKAINFVQKIDQEYKGVKQNSNPIVKLPTADHFGLTEDKEKKLSEIIAEINSKSGKAYDNDIVVKAMLQIRDLMLKSEKLKTSAKNNTADDFNYTFFDNVDDALIEGLEQNQDFFSLLLNNEEMKHQVLGVFAGEIYQNLRQSI